jgi:hypothetical protein
MSLRTSAHAKSYRVDEKRPHLRELMKERWESLMNSIALADLEVE